jgi:hypothetical protein
MVIEEKSEPRAPNAPPIAVLLAVPPNLVNAYLSASSSFWALTVCVHRFNNIAIPQPIFVIDFILFVFKS